MTGGKIIVSLMGGLGNQMFQYAAARALAHRNSAELIIDTTTGFLRDKIYKRRYELDRFTLNVRKASYAEQLPFWIERVVQRLGESNPSGITRRPWGTFLSDTAQDLVSGAFEEHRHTLFVRGYWPSEAYFADARDIIGSELQPPRPDVASFSRMACRIEECNSVAVGVRLFEEISEIRRALGVVEMSRYSHAARLLAETIDRPEFFVFCASQSAQLTQLDLPGPIHLLTPANGYGDPIECLWLMSCCRNHIISNSTFYWWGAWLAEFQRPETRVVAMDPTDKSFNRASIPARWVKIEQKE